MIQDPVAARKAKIEAARAAAKAGSTEALAKVEKITLIPVEECKERLRVVFDNSGSMGSSVSYGNTVERAIDSAKKGTVEFLRNCVPNRDAVAVHLLNNRAGWQGYEQEAALTPLIANTVLTSDLVSLANAVDHPSISPTGGTPLIETILNALNDTPRATRIIAFSDGEAGDTYKKGVVISIAKSLQIPIDTVFIGSSTEYVAIALMKELASETGGIFLLFDPAKGVNFKDAFKYLSPGKRLMLMDKSFVAKLEKGEVK